MRTFWHHTIVFCNMIFLLTPSTPICDRQSSAVVGIASEITMSLTPVMVHGGFRIMDVTEARVGDDIEVDYEWTEESEVLYAEEYEAELAVQGMKK